MKMMRSLLVNPFLKKRSIIVLVDKSSDKPNKPATRKPEIITQAAAAAATHAIYREELDDAARKPPSHRQGKVKKKVRFALDQPGAGEGKEEEEEEKKKESGGGSKVKILMSRAEAERLLSRCKDGGVLAFTDVVSHHGIIVP